MANTPQSYTSKFRTLNPAKLAEIIVREEDYHPDAVTAARLELTARMLPVEELDRIYAAAEKQMLSQQHKVPTREHKKREKKPTGTGEVVGNQSSIWGRTITLKLTLAYLIIDALLNSYLNFAAYYFDGAKADGAWILLVFPLVQMLLLAFVIWLGRKGLSFVYIIAAMLTLFKITAAIFNIRKYYAYINLYKNEELPSYLNLDEPLTMILKLIIPLVLFILLCLKTNRATCGLTRTQLAQQNKN